jgi:hypothetical protein
MSNLEALLSRNWVHSHEEDTSTQMVFRPASYSFPPSRGRHGFELLPGGIAKASGPGPGDAPQVATASWSLANDRALQLRLADSGQVINYAISSVEPDKLIIQK